MCITTNIRIPISLCGMKNQEYPYYFDTAGTVYILHVVIIYVPTIIAFL